MSMRCGDEAVQSTNDDAQQSKASCAMLGYFRDDFVNLFVKKPKRKAPLMNRGYYTRHRCISALLEQFRAACAAHEPPLPCQVLALGAGFDTTYFQLKSQGKLMARYLELDFEEIVARKCMTVGTKPELHDLLHRGNSVTRNPHSGAIVSNEYCLLAADLRNLDQVEAALDKAQFDRTQPTFILSECVLVYMQPQESDALVQRLGDSFPTAALVIYEQIQPDTQFGRQMVKNLEQRGAPLYGVRATPTLQAHEDRLTSHGWQRAFSADLNTVYRRHIEPADRMRIEALEVFDEFEEWHLIMGHYCLAVAVNDAAGVLHGYAFQEHGVSVAAARKLHGGVATSRAPALPNAD